MGCGTVRRAITLAAGVLCAGGAAGRSFAEPAPALLVFDGGTSPGAAAAARAALVARAPQRGLAFVDLGPRLRPPPQTDRHLARAIEAYHRLAHAEALASADAGLAEAVADGADGIGPAQLAELHLYRALALTEVGETAAAWEAFVDAARVDPTRILDPARFAPRVIETFERARAAVAAQPVIAVSIPAPVACRRWLDGRAVEAEATASPGPHIVRVACEGHEPWAASQVLAGPSAVVRPAVRARVAPDASAVAALAAERGLAGGVLARVVSLGGSPAIVVERIDRRGRVIARVAASLDAGGAAVGSALDRALVDPTAAPPARSVRSALLWGAVGAAVAAAVILPIALGRDGGADGFEVSARPGP